MDSSCSSSSFSVSPCVITNEDFNLFHSIDRMLFSILVHNLSRDPAEMMQVMGFLLWLESSFWSINTVKKVLEWPGNLIDQLANQVLAILHCVERYSFSWQARGDISLLQKLCTENISVHQFYENRIRVLKGVSKSVDEVCVRAFSDLLGPRPRIGEFRNNEGEASISVYHYPHPHPHPRPFLPPPVRPNFTDVGFRGDMNFPRFFPNDFGVRGEAPPQAHLREVLRGMNLGDHSEGDYDVPPDERTIFLTFSKGYPISETEVREYFTRLFGNFIESIQMQEVQGGEQPLFARMVARTSSIVPSIARLDVKTKYVINGKHVWARKFVRKINEPGSQSEANHIMENPET